jgi:hypothetical protein
MATTLGSLAVTVLMSGAIFCLAWGMALLLRSLQGRQVAASPFATHTPPPQLLEPEVPDS